MGGARRRLRTQGKLPEHPGHGETGDRDGAARAGDRSGACRRPHLARHDAALRSAESTRRSRRSARRSGSSPRTARPTRVSRARYWVGKGDFAAAIPLFERAIALNPEAGYSYLQLSMLLAWAGSARSRRGDQPSRRGAAGAVHLRQPRPADRGRAFAARLRRTTCRATTTRRCGSTSASWRSSARAITRCAIARCSSSTSRSAPSYLRQGREEDARAALRTGAEELRRARRHWRRRSVHALLHRRASMRSAATPLMRSTRSSGSPRSFPALTAARARIDVDLESLRDEPRFQAITAPR